MSLAKLPYFSQDVADAHGEKTVDDHPLTNVDVLHAAAPHPITVNTQATR
jgi:hypothetical protein